MLAGEGQCIVQAIGEKDLIKAGAPVFKSHRGSVKKEPPHAGKGFIEHLLYFCQVSFIVVCPEVQSVSVMQAQVLQV